MRFRLSQYDHWRSSYPNANIAGSIPDAIATSPRVYAEGAVRLGADKRGSELAADLFRRGRHRSGRRCLPSELAMLDTVLVIGSAGYIGSHICKALAAAGA